MRRSSNDLDFSTQASVNIADIIRSVGDPVRRDWIIDEIGRDGFIFLQDGALLGKIFQETIYAFSNAQFITTTLLSFCLIERSIAGRLLHINDQESSHTRKPEKLMKAAVRERWITENESKDLVELFKNARNPLAHFREPGHVERFEAEQLEENAKRSLSIALRIVLTTSI